MDADRRSRSSLGRRTLAAVCLAFALAAAAGNEARTGRKLARRR
jgi:hypothetical protein